jgi:hypothetical protein
MIKYDTGKFAGLLDGELVNVAGTIGDFTRTYPKT